MRIEGHDRFGKPFSIPASRLVVFDNHKNAVAVAVDLSSGPASHVYVAHREDPEWDEVLRACGLADSVVVTYLDPAEMKPLEPR